MVFYNLLPCHLERLHLQNPVAAHSPHGIVVMEVPNVVFGICTSKDDGTTTLPQEKRGDGTAHHRLS